MIPNAAVSAFLVAAFALLIVMALAVPVGLTPLGAAPRQIAYHMQCM
jgi:hypothetical protein